MKSDVWSLGITLIELALGRFPFSNDDEEEDDDDYDDDGYREEELTLSPVKPPGRERSLAELDARKKEKAARAAEKKGGAGGGGGGAPKKGVSLGGSGSQMSILELLQHVVNEPAPRLKPEGKFKKEAEVFVDSCLEKDVTRRPTPKELLVSRIVSEMDIYVLLCCVAIADSFLWPGPFQLSEIQMAYGSERSGRRSGRMGKDYPMTVISRQIYRIFCVHRTRFPGTSTLSESRCALTRGGWKIYVLHLTASISRLNSMR